MTEKSVVAIVIYVHPASHVMLDHRTYPDLDRLALSYNGLHLYGAGLPRFMRLFSRDLLLSAFLFRDAGFLQDILAFCALRQGKRTDAYTGMEPGKIPHEVPGVVLSISGKLYSTEYNACDTTALFLIGLRLHHEWTGQPAMVTAMRGEARRCLEYLERHVDKSGLFWDGPSYSGATERALVVNYWKDNFVISARENGTPSYPAAYALLQAKTAAAFRAASELAPLLGLSDERLGRRARRVAGAFWSFWDGKSIALGRDQQGLFPGIASDVLHALAYLQPDSIDRDKFDSALSACSALETPFGYRTSASQDPGYSADNYHNGSIWPFEQAFIARGARSHGLRHVEEVARRVLRCLQGSYPEALRWEEGMDAPTLATKSCHTQLWSIAAHAALTARQ